MPKPSGIKLSCSCGNRAFLWSTRGRSGMEMYCTNCHSLYVMSVFSQEHGDMRDVEIKEYPSTEED